MARKKEYTPETLSRAVEKYFKSISRIVKLTEQVPTDQKDSSGHVIYEKKPVFNCLGKQVEVTEFLVPPSVGGLCAFLGIHRSTWAEYCKNEEFSDTTTHARGRMQAWREEQLVTRKDVKGIVFDLENNYGYREQKQVQVTGSVEDFIAGLTEQGEGGQRF